MSERKAASASGPAIGIAGAGRVGQAMGRLLRERGARVVALAGRNSARTAAAAAFIGPGVVPVSYAELPAEATHLLIAVPDQALMSVAGQLAAALPYDPLDALSRVFLHTCGARGVEALAALSATGAMCGVLHPLQTFATPQQGVQALPGAAFAYSGSPEAAEWAAELVMLLGGEILRLRSGTQPLYHAAAVLASNCVTALVDSAMQLLAQAGLDQTEALRVLSPLLLASANNTALLGPENALTGPIERGDAETITAHLRALASAPEGVRSLYRAAGLQTVALARRKHPDSNFDAIEALLRPAAS